MVLPRSHMAQVNKSARLPGTRKHIASSRPTRERQTPPFRLCIGIGTLARLFQTKGRKKQPQAVHSGTEASTAVRRQTVNLPQDVLEIIIANLSDDIRSLKAVSTTCYSWYLAAVPHLHHALVLGGRDSEKAHTELKPLTKLHGMDLLPFVKKLWIQTAYIEPWLSPRKFDRKTLRSFAALTNVQQLRIERLDLSKFMSGVERYFGHFAPALRSIALILLFGTQRQLSHFLALFPNLDDIEIVFYSSAKHDITTKPGPEVAVPFPVPSLRGQLKFAHFWSETAIEGMITSFGGLRFRYMDLRDVKGARLLLEACADTLETVRIDLTFTKSAEPALHDPTLTERPGASGGMLKEFNLSRLHSLRSLEVTTASMSEIHTSCLFRDIASTITSPVFSEVILVFRYLDLNHPYPILFYPLLFDALRHTYSKRRFRMVFCLEVVEKDICAGMQMMRERLEWETIHGRLDFLASPPTLVVGERNPWTG